MNRYTNLGQRIAIAMGIMLFGVTMWGIARWVAGWF